MAKLSVTNYLIGLILPGPSLIPTNGIKHWAGSTRSLASRKVRIYISSRIVLNQRPFTYNFQRTPLFFETNSTEPDDARDIVQAGTFAVGKRNNCRAQHSGDLRSVAPPVPIPNTEVKRAFADGSASIGCARVGRCQYHEPRRGKPRRGFFLPPSFRQAQDDGALKNPRPLPAKKKARENNPPGLRANWNK